MKIVNAMPLPRNQRYDWNVIFDGKIRQFEPTDFKGILAESFAGMVQKAAKRRNLRAIIRCRGKDVYVQTEAEKTKNTKSRR